MKSIIFWTNISHITMGIYGVYIVSKSGGLIFNYDYTVPKIETEQTFSYPLDLKLSCENNRLLVSFGQRDNIKGIELFKR